MRTTSQLGAASRTRSARPARWWIDRAPPTHAHAARAAYRPRDLASSRSTRSGWQRSSSSGGFGRPSRDLVVVARQPSEQHAGELDGVVTDHGAARAPARRGCCAAPRSCRRRSSARASTGSRSANRPPSGSPYGPRSASMPCVPASSFAIAITCWPCSSDSALRTDASGPGSSPRTRAETVRSRISRSTSDFDVERARAAGAAAGRCVPPWSRTRSMHVVRGRSAAPQRAFARQRHALVAERHLREAPAVVLGADDVRGRNAHVGEEHLVELVRAGHLHERPHLDARRAHVDDEVRDAVVRSASGSVRASRMPNCATCASVVQTFCPFTTYSSPSRTARVVTATRGRCPRPVR